MRLRLSYKLFGAFLVTALILVSLIVLMQYYASSSFADYVSNVELEKLGELEERLITEHEAHEGWEHLRHNHRRWLEVLADSGFHLEPPPPHDHMPPPPPPPPPSHHMTPPPFHETPQHGMPPPPTHAEGALGMGPRVSLRDAEKRLVIGNRAPLQEQVLRRIQVDGKTVGWIGLKKRERLSSPLEAAFLEKQYKVFYLVGIGALVLTALVSFFLSRHLLLPIKRLTEGTQALISRQFKTRIRVRSSDELGQLASNFNRMAEHLERFEQIRQQWISDISHELRTPLSILRGEIEALQDGVRKVTPGTLDSLHSETVRLGKLVDDLHQLSLADSQDLSLKRDSVKPVHVLEETLKSFHTKLSQRKIDVQFSPGEHQGLAVAGDGERLTQLFSNILENTWRYADSPGILKIRVNHSKQLLTIHFEDSGPGVPEKSLERLFDRLYRVDKSRSRSLGGSGLGLAICRHIVETHGGSISAENGPSGGLLIKVELPLI